MQDDFIDYQIYPGAGKNSHRDQLKPDFFLLAEYFFSTNQVRTIQDDCRVEGRFGPNGKDVLFRKWEHR